MVTDGYSSEEQRANSAEMKKVQTNDMSYQEKSAASAMRARLELDGVSAEKSCASIQVCQCANCQIYTRVLDISVKKV